MVTDRVSHALNFLLLMAIVLAGGAARAAEFITIPDCMTPRVARDGSGVFAQSSVNVSPSLHEFYRWTPAGGVESHFVGFRTRDIHATSTGAFHATGKQQVGAVAGIGPHYQIFSWSLDEGYALLEHPFPTAEARYEFGKISSDGSYIAGTQVGYPAVIADPVAWDRGEPIRPYTPVPLGYPDGGILALNATGSVAWGWVSTSGLWGLDAYVRWADGEPPVLTPPPLGYTNPQMQDVLTSTGTILGRGRSLVLDEWQSFMITDGVLEPIPLLNDIHLFTGSFIAEGPLVLGRLFRPSLWDPVNGHRDVMTWAVDDLELDLQGAELLYEYGISDDGNVMVFESRVAGGSSFNCSILVVPEPGLVSGLVLGSLALALFGGRR